MGINQLLARSPNRTLTWLEDQAGVEFSELLHELTDKNYRVLRTSSDEKELFKAQGALDVLATIIGLPAEIRSYLHDVSTGKRKKIEEVVRDGLAR